MPITQDRLLAIVSAGEAFAEALAFAQSECGQALRAYAAAGNPAEVREALIDQLAFAIMATVRPEHYVTLSREREYFRLMYHRNLRIARKRESQRRAQGVPTKEASIIALSTRSKRPPAPAYASSGSPKQRPSDYETFVEPEGNPDDFLSDFLGAEAPSTSPSPAGLTDEAKAEIDALIEREMLAQAPDVLPKDILG